MNFLKKQINGVKSINIKKMSPKLTVLVLSSIMLFVFFTSLAMTANRVTIYENDTVYSKYTIFSTVEEILADEEIVLEENDIYRFSGFEDNEGTITILRAFDVSITADGVTNHIVMNEGNVLDALTQVGVTLGADDLVNISVDEALTNDTDIVVNRVVYNTYDIQTEIPYVTSNPEVRNMSGVNVSVDVKGVNGVLATTYKDTVVDGAVVNTQTIGENIVKNPVNEVLEATKTVYVGAVPKEFPLDEVPVELDANGIPVNYSRKVSGVASAYSALGKPTKLTPGAVAMNLSMFPRGTRLYIVSSNGNYIYGYSTVRDTGTAVNDGRVLVDCFFNTYKESCQFGLKDVDVYVLD